MPSTYQTAYPSPPLVDSASLRTLALGSWVRAEYFEAPEGAMPTDTFDRHHILLNLRDRPQRTENWRDGEHQTFEFAPDEIVVTPAGTTSGWRWHGVSKVIVVTLDPERFERFAWNELNVALTEQQLRDQTHIPDRDLCRIAVMIVDADKEEGVAAGVLFEAFARAFLVKLVRRYSVPLGEPDLAGGLGSERFGRVASYVAEHFGGNILVADLAAAASLSPTHFSRLFARTMNRSPMRFVTEYRVERARQLLDDPSEPLAAVALACGFADQAHFSRTFSRLTGSSPSEYRLQAARSDGRIGHEDGSERQDRGRRGA